MSSPDPPLALRWIRAANSEWFLPGPPTAEFARRLYQDFEGQEGYLLENLSSLVRIPPADDHESRYEFYHRSLIDFLLSPERCGRSFHDSYHSGESFFCDRWYGVLRAQSTVVPLTGSEWLSFLHCFWPFFEDVMKELAFWRPDVISSCDIAAWIRMICAVWDNVRQKRMVDSLFDWIHEGCSVPLHGGCSKMCRHWRSAILGECKRLGWDTPTHIYLLLDMMFNTHVQFRDDLFEDDFDCPIGGEFQPPRKLSHSLPVVVPCSEMRSLAYKQSDFEEYEPKLAVMEMVCRALPRDWECRALEIFDCGGSTEDAFRAQLLRVCPLQMEGLDEWLDEGWSGKETNSVEVAKVEEGSSGSE